MVIIDFHSHIGKTGKPINFQKTGEITIDDVLAEQERVGINFSTAIPFPFAYPEDVYRNNAEIMSIQDTRFLPFIWINPYFLRTNDKRGQDEAELIRTIKKGRVYGLKVHPVMDGYYPAPNLMGPVMEIARATNLPVLWHTGWAAIGGSGSFGEARYVEYSAKAFPDVKIVIGHLVDPNAPDIAERNNNVYLETSYCSGGRRLAGIVSQIGSERILFGSDLGVNFPGKEMKTVLDARLPDKDTENILGLNAIRILNLQI